MKKTVHFIANNWLLLILVFLGIFVPWHWFADGRLIAGGDNLFYYNPTGAFYENFFTWINRINFGEPNYAVAFLFPFLSFFKVLSLLGFSPVASEILWAIGLFLLPGIFMFLLVRELLSEKNSWREGGAFIAALFYMFNPYIMTDMLQISQRPVQMVLPLLFLLWHKGLASPAERLKYSLLFALATLLTASTGTAPAFLAIIPLALFLYTVFYGIFYRPSTRHVFLFVSQTAIFCLVFNLWWLVPAASAYRESGAALQKTIKAGDYTKATPLWESLRLMGFWAFRIEWGNKIPHIPYAHYYYEPLFLSFSYFLVALGFFGLLLRKQLRRQLFFAALFLLGVFLSKGAKPPLGETYQWLFENLPLFSLFREPFSKLTTLSLFSLAVLLGLSWGKAALWFGGRRRYFMTLSLIVVMLVYSFPILTGQVVQDPSWHGITRDSLHVEIPRAWYDIGRWFEKNDPTGRIILFPKSGYGVCYNWAMGSCVGQPVARLFVPNQTIRYAPTIDYARDQVIISLYDSLFDGILPDLASPLRFLGISYILQQNDLDWQHAMKGAYSPGEVVSLLQGVGQVEKRESFGPLDLYHIGGNIYPLIYATNQFSLISGDAINFGKLASLRPLAFPESFYFLGGAAEADGEVLEKLKALSSATIVFSDEQKITVPEAGLYDLYFLPEGTGLDPAANFPEEMAVRVGEEKSFSLRRSDLKNQKKAWLSLGRSFFAIGESSLNFSFNPSMQPVSADNLAVEEFRRFSSDNDLIRGLTVSAEEPLLPGHYLVGFSYAAFGGRQLSFSVREERCEQKQKCSYTTSPLLEVGLPLRSTPASYQGEFTLIAPAKRVRLQFEVPGANEESRLAVGSLGLARRFGGDMVMIKAKELQGGLSAPTALPQLSFRHISPTAAEVYVAEANQPYFLAFNESFSRNWKVQLVSEENPSYFRPPRVLPEARHFLVNGFANGWYIEPEDVFYRENYTLLLAYQPQRFFILSLAVSLASVLLALIFLIRRFHRA